MQERLHHHDHTFGGQIVGIHQWVQRTNGSVEDIMQHTKDQKLVQHLVHKVQILHRQDGQR